jgi:hypothetical protein
MPPPPQIIFKFYYLKNLQSQKQVGHNKDMVEILTNARTVQWRIQEFEKEGRVLENEVVKICSHFGN